MPNLAALRSLFQQEKETIVRDFFTFLRFPTITTDPAYQEEVHRCANWLVRYLQEKGLTVEKWESDRAPVLFISDLRAGPHKKTLLLYGHYDVQPVDPLDEWLSPPFEPTVRDGEVYARGAVDNKGQCWYTLWALILFLREKGAFPVNVKMVLEGEEESGSAGLAALLPQKKKALAADYLLIVDSGIEERHTPAVTLGARGILCAEVTLQEASCDLHSGMAGGLAYNPNRALAELLAALYDPKGRVTLPGFYKGIVALTPEERHSLALKAGTSTFATLFGCEPMGGEEGYSPAEANWLRPTLEINGLWGGYTGAGFKTVIPASAHAKLSCRLVPGQEPEPIADALRQFVTTHTPRSMRSSVTILPGYSRGFRTSPTAPLVQMVAESYTDVFGKPCQKILIGGTIPIALPLAATSGADPVLIGLGLPGDRVHAPNEHFGLDRLETGFLTLFYLLERLH